MAQREERAPPSPGSPLGSQDPESGDPRGQRHPPEPGDRCWPRRVRGAEVSGERPRVLARTAEGNQKSLFRGRSHKVTKSAGGVSVLGPPGGGHLSVFT